MSFLLCQDCLAWGEPLSGLCPHCFAPLDRATPDPSLDDIQARLGEFLGRLGEIRIARRRLPKLGMLYATTTGLYFLPHEVRTIERTQQAAPGSSLSMVLIGAAANIWTPLMFASPFLKNRIHTSRQFTVHRPHFLTRDDTSTLAARLMGHPGTFFLARDSIAAFEKHWTCWTIRRRCGSQLSFKPCAIASTVRRRLETYLSSGRIETELASAV